MKIEKPFSPFGMLMPGRSALPHDYRFGFNGKENDNEVKGEGNSVDFGERSYDSRSARFISIDPFSAKFPYESNYLFAGNNPINMIDINGLFKFRVADEVKEKYPQLTTTRFENILKNLEKYVNNNKEIYSYIAVSTGLNKEQIVEAIHSGSGPEIVIVNSKGALGSTGVPFSSFKKGEVSWDVNDLLSLENANDEDLGVYVLKTIGVLFHEETHFGDRQKNNGWITGQAEDIFDEENKVTPANGTQSKKQSDTKHRGEDTEQLFYNDFINKKIRVPALNKDGTLDEDAKKYYRQTPRYKKDSKDLIKMTKDEDY